MVVLGDFYIIRNSEREMEMSGKLQFKYQKQKAVTVNKNQGEVPKFEKLNKCWG
jgi:hypothetical protein